MNTFAHVPPGFRFHPTDEELVDYYLRKKVNSRMIDLDVVKDVDLYKIEPWDLQEICRLGTDEQNEWYFFSHKDKKYPTGTRTNRATAAGFWKATGRDKAIYSKHDLIGMRKTLVFYKGRAPNGQKSDWIMHEYRLQTDENGTTQEEGWVVCRVFKKKTPTMHKLMSEHESSCWYEDQVSSFMQDLDSPKPRNSVLPNSNNNNNPCKKELDLPYHYHHVPHMLHQLPLLNTPKVNFQSAYDEEAQVHQQQNTNQQNFQVMYNDNNGNEEMTDWRVLDKLVASQLSQEDASKPMSFDLVLLDSSPELKNASLNLSWSQINREKEYASKDNSYSSANLKFRDLDKEKLLGVPDENNASTSTSSCPIDLWK